MILKINNNNNNYNQNNNKYIHTFNNNSIKNTYSILIKHKDINKVQMI